MLDFQWSPPTLLIPLLRRNPTINTGTTPLFLLFLAISNLFGDKKALSEDGSFLNLYRCTF